MSHNWPTRDKDMQAARVIIEDYASDKEAIGLFELEVDHHEKRMNFRLSQWVVILARYFASQYGAVQGDLITRMVISNCIIQHETVH